MPQQYSVISSSINTTYTGSIARIQAIGTYPQGIAGYPSCSHLQRIEFGTNPASPVNTIGSFDTTHQGCISVPNGTVIEGPITALKTSGSALEFNAGWLIYHNAYPTTGATFPH